MPATMPALQYMHEAPLWLGAEAPYPVVHSGSGYIICALPVHSLPLVYAQVVPILSFTVHQGIN